MCEKQKRERREKRGKKRTKENQEKMERRDKREREREDKRRVKAEGHALVGYIRLHTVRVSHVCESMGIV